MIHTHVDTVREHLLRIARHEVAAVDHVRSLHDAARPRETAPDAPQPARLPNGPAGRG